MLNPRRDQAGYNEPSAQEVQVGAPSGVCKGSFKGNYRGSFKGYYKAFHLFQREWIRGALGGFGCREGLHKIGIIFGNRFWKDFVGFKICCRFYEGKKLS